MIRPGSIVELAGPPGAGKTTLVPLVRDALRSEGLKPRGSTEVGRDLAARGLIGRVTWLFPVVLRHPVLWRLYVLEASVAGWLRIIREPSLRRLVLRQRSRPPEAMVDRRKVVGHFVRHLGTVLLFRRRWRGLEVLLVDEGFVHRVTQLFVSSMELPDPDAITAYLTAVPNPGLIVAVAADTPTCISRVMERGVWNRMAGLSESQIRTFIENAAVASARAISVARDLGMHVEILENIQSEPPDKAVVGQVLNVTHPGDSPALRLGVAPLRPGTVLAAVAQRWTRDGVEAAQIESVLNEAGVEGKGVPWILAGGRRSAMVAIETSHGTLVVKRYADHWPIESIHHEHDVLTVLADRGFPSVRLFSSPAGRRLFAAHGRNHSVYDFISGRSYSGRILTRSMTERLLVTLGRLLADLHSTLEAVELGHRHHLGLDPDSHRPFRDLDWYLGRFEAFRAFEAGDDGGITNRVRVDLTAVEPRLIDVHRRLTSGDLSVSIIHGDFGPHNVLFTKDGPIIHDFELARVDWRLTDLAIVLVRLRSDFARRALVTGYRSQIDVDPHDLRDAIEWHLLAGAVYAWDRFVRRDDPVRLGVARQRIELAQSGLAERTLSWS